MRITLKDLARRLSVSTATVSNAFSRPDQLSADLRARILAEASRLGYHGPNATARSLRRGKSGIIGLILADRLQYNFEDPVATRFLHGLSEVFDARGVNLLMLPGRAEFYRNQNISSLADGYIVYGPPRDSSILDRIMGSQKGAVTVDFDIPGVRSVNIDNEAAAYTSARHGLQRTRPPLAIIGLRLVPDGSRVEQLVSQKLVPYQTSVSRRRLKGYLRACREQGLGPRDYTLWNAPDSRYELGYQAARDALRQTPRPRLLLCMSDRLALGAIAAAEDMGLTIPDDLGVIGFDDIPTAAFQRPALTTVHQPQHEKGRQAAALALAAPPAEHQKTRTLATTLATRLVIRDSC